MSAPANDLSVVSQRTAPETREALRRIAALIRLGAAQRPQCYRHMFTWGAIEGMRSCALGALYEGYYGYCLNTDRTSIVQPILERVGLSPFTLFGWPTSYDFAGRVADAYPIIDTIFLLNDRVRLSREEIADIVKTLEVAP